MGQSRLPAFATADSRFLFLEGAARASRSTLPAIMVDLEKIPTWLKAMVVIGVLAIGPTMLFAFWFAGPKGGIAVVLTMIVYFTVIYIVGIRKYVGPES